ncbi:hypothetical protein E3T61_04680 [Cryobacterium lactosi]|uniref:Uncharacterized protein n=1 Tax=Cryobacterium lactosi TaxID=1259202 RepID=A0A4V3IXV5_9MICO|nr:hypothetical protein [Cryobacterium lactosi]TFD93393.1 hypothetical protein E3T61_04680 [Cryobacterium lactosi]
MSTNDSYSAAALQYLAELESALAGVPADLRAEITADLAGELRGLDEGAAAARIVELGDPRAIAADASAEAETAAAQTATAQPIDARMPVSLAYPTAAAIVLTAGWYLVPIVGWIVGLVMIGAGSRWAPQVRVASVCASVAAALVAVVALVVFRGTEVWLIGAAAFAIVPLIANVFVGGYLRRQWGLPAPV